MAEWVEDTSDAPGVLSPDGADDGGSGCDGAIEGGVGVFDSEDHADGAAVEALGAEVLVLGRLVGDPEACSIDGEVGEHGALVVLDAKEFGGSEGGFIKLDGFGGVADGEEGGDGGLWGAGALGGLRHGGVLFGWLPCLMRDDITCKKLRDRTLWWLHQLLSGFLRLECIACTMADVDHAH
jgi:hypothetical protein